MKNKILLLIAGVFLLSNICFADSPAPITEDSSGAMPVLKESGDLAIPLLEEEANVPPMGGNGTYIMMEEAEDGRIITTVIKLENGAIVGAEIGEGTEPLVNFLNNNEIDKQEVEK